MKVPLEQYEEVVAGRGDLVDWLTAQEMREALVLQEEANPVLVAGTTIDGYGNLDEQGIELVGRDPFLIAYARADLGSRTVVTFEVSKRTQKGARSKVPDVCADFRVPCCNLFDMIHALDFTTNWRR